MEHREPLWELMGLLFKAHPWHGIDIGQQAPNVVTTYIEIVPTDTVKYEIDKITGHLTIDRPQKYSNVCPALYGFIPQTLCANHTAALSAERTGRTGIVGDGDPLDICVLTEKTVSHGNILAQAVPIGGLRLLDKGEADDKIIAVLQGDIAYSGWGDINDLSTPLLERLQHYFLTYKSAPGATQQTCEVTHVYSRHEAYEVIRRSQEDYRERFGHLPDMLTAALRG
jgi:inorganic pyrophosphatase